MIADDELQPTALLAQRTRPVAPRHRLLADADGEPRCTACGECEGVCPAKCIDVVARPAGASETRTVAASFCIDQLQCVFCGLCVQACPEDALRMDTDLPAPAFYVRDDARVERVELMALCGRPGAKAAWGQQNEREGRARGR